MDKELDYKAKRIMGWVAICFVPLCVLFYLLFGEKIEGFNPMIAFSCFYWTNSRTIYIAGFVTVNLYFAIFNGKTRLERILSWSFIVCAIVHLFSPLQDDDILVHNFTTMFNLLPDQDLTAGFWLHHLSSYMIVPILVLYVLLIFARHEDNETAQKKMRRRWYYGACIFAGVIIICIVNLLTYDFNIILPCQILCFVALGSCWVVEGGGVKAWRD